MAPICSPADASPTSSRTPAHGLGSMWGRYSFIAVDFHHLLLAGLPAHSLELRPAHSRRHLYVTSYTEGFSHFVTSMTAPVASGWSGCRVGLAPTGKCRLLKAHT